MFPIDSDYPSCEALVGTFAQILLKVDDYQGDSRLLLHDMGRFGLLFFGWGSCSGCDALEAASGNRDHLRELRDDLAHKTHWEGSPQALMAHIERKDWSLDFDGDSPASTASTAFRERALEILHAIADGRTDLAAAIDAGTKAIEV